jgi:hypothetical protein
MVGANMSHRTTPYPLLKKGGGISLHYFFIAQVLHLLKKSYYIKHKSSTSLKKEGAYGTFCQ